MPHFTLPIPETYENFSRPVVYSIADHLIKLLGIDDQINILFIDENSESTFSIGSALDNKKESIRLPTSDRLDITAAETTVQEALTEIKANTTEYPAVFVDKNLGVVIRPHYKPIELSLEIKYRARNRNEAKIWKNNIAARIPSGLESGVLSVDYHYSLPPVFNAILSEIHRLREQVAGYDETLAEWYGASFTDRSTTVVNRKGEHPLLVIKERNPLNAAWFDFDGEPEKGGREDGNETWYTSFTYKVRLYKPISCSILYPLMIHNQVIKYHFQKPAPTVPDKTSVYYSNSARALSALEVNRHTRDLSRVGEYSGIIIPEYDDFVPLRDYVPRDTMRVFTALVALNHENGQDPNYLFDLSGELDQFRLKENVIEYLKDCRSGLTQASRHPFNISIFRQNYRMQEDRIRVDDDLGVWTTTPLDVRDYHHIRFSIFRRLDLLPDHVKDCLRHHGSVVIDILDAIDPSIRERDELPKIIGDDLIPKDEFDRAIKPLVPGYYRDRPKSSHMHTVQQLFVQIRN